MSGESQSNMREHEAIPEDLPLRLCSRFIHVELEEMDGQVEAGLRDVAEAVAADAVYLLALDAAGESLVRTRHAAATATGREQREPIPQRWPVADWPGLWSRLMEREATHLCAGELAQGVSEVEWGRLAGRGVASFWWLPMTIRGAVSGVMVIERRGVGDGSSAVQPGVLQFTADLLSQALDRQSAHQRLASHVDNAPLAVLEWDKDFRLNRWSGTAEQIFGWTAEEVLGRSWAEWEFVYVEDSQTVRQIVEQLTLGGKRSNTLINRNMTKDGRVIVCEWFNSALVGVSGEPDSYLSFARDITERQAVRQALESREEELRRLNAELEQRVARRTGQLKAVTEEAEERAKMLRAILDVSPAHVYLFDGEGRFRFISQAVRDDLGEITRGVIGKLPSESRYPKDVVDTFEQKWLRMVETRQPQSAEAELDSTRGRRRYAYTITPSFDEQGGLASAVCSAYDVTERNLAETALRESEVRYRHLAEHATDVISRHDTDGRFTYVSPACRSLLGYDPEQLVGQHPEAIAYEADRPLVVDNLKRLRETQQVLNTTYRVVHRDGRIVWAESASRNDGQEIVVVTRDVTVRHDAEQRLRLIQAAVEQVDEAVVITDAQIEKPGPSIVYVNPAFTHMTGYSAEEAIRNSPRLLQGDRTERRILDRLRKSMQLGQPFVAEAINYKKDGSEYFVEWHITPLRDADGQVTHWVSIQRDITERIHAEQSAKAQREELAHASRLTMIGEMYSGIAHEVNQPLAAISNYLHGCMNRIRRGATGEEIQDTLGRVIEQADRAAKVIRHLRAFTSKRGSPREVADLNELVRTSLSLLQLDDQNHELLELDFADPLPPLEVDSIQIQQVIINLVRNGLEAMRDAPASTKRLTIRTRRDGPINISVSVIDRGPGLSEEQTKSLFSPFFTTKDQGMGLGLVISRSIVEAHNGRLIYAAGEPGGCVFTVRLPCVAEATQ